MDALSVQDEADENLPLQRTPHDPHVLPQQDMFGALLLANSLHDVTY